MTKDELKDYLIEEAEYNEMEVEEMNPLELIDAWLQWNGIIGYTGEILDVFIASGINLNDFTYENR